MKHEPERAAAAADGGGAATATAEPPTKSPILEEISGAAQTAAAPIAVRALPRELQPVEDQPPEDVIMREYGLTPSAYALAWRFFGEGVPRIVMAGFLRYCKMRNLDPFLRQVYLWNDKQDGTGKWNIVSGIDGIRTIASRSPYFRGITEPEWTFERDERGNILRFTAEESIYGAIAGKRRVEECRVYSVRAIPQAPTDPALYLRFAGIVRFDEFVKRDAWKPGPDGRGKIKGNWETQPEHQSRIRCEAMAYRAGFPEEVGGIYTEDELRDHQRDDAVTVPERETIVAAGASPHAAEIEELAGKLKWTIAKRKTALQSVGGDEEKLVQLMRQELEPKQTRGREPGTGEVVPEAPPAPAAAAPPAAGGPPDHTSATAQQGNSDAAAPAAAPAAGGNERLNATPGSRTDQQQRGLFGLLNKLGIKEKPDRIAWAARAGIKIASFKDLSQLQAHVLLGTAEDLVREKAAGEPLAPLFDGDEPEHPTSDDGQRQLDGTPVQGSFCGTCRARHAEYHFRGCPEDEPGGLDGAAGDDNGFWSNPPR